MDKLLAILQLGIVSMFVYASIKYLLPESQKCFRDKKCISWTRTSHPKVVKGKQAVKTGIYYVIISLLFIFALILTLQKIF